MSGKSAAYMNHKEGQGVRARADLTVTPINAAERFDPDAPLTAAQLIAAGGSLLRKCDACDEAGAPLVSLPVRTVRKIARMCLELEHRLAVDGGTDGR